MKWRKVFRTCLPLSTFLNSPNLLKLHTHEQNFVLYQTKIWEIPGEPKPIGIFKEMDLASKVKKIQPFGGHFWNTIPLCSAKRNTITMGRVKKLPFSWVTSNPFWAGFCAAKFEGSLEKYYLFTFFGQCYICLVLISMQKKPDILKYALRISLYVMVWEFFRTIIFFHFSDFDFLEKLCFY